jgi:aspartate carbamoyltransferase regulatory subunit
LLGLKEDVLDEQPIRHETKFDELPCSNTKCITSVESYLHPETEMIAGMPCCIYCGHFK